MKILATQYTLSMRSLDIYTAGCKAPHCQGCHNPDGWDFNNGTVWGDEVKDSISKKVLGFEDLISRFMIFGGEPLDNPIEDLVDFFNFISKFDRPVWLFTRYSIEEVPKEIQQFCDYIKCGRYEEAKKVDGYIQYDIELATSNQKIYKKDVDY